MSLDTTIALTKDKKEDDLKLSTSREDPTINFDSIQRENPTRRQDTIMQENQDFAARTAASSVPMENAEGGDYGVLTVLELYNFRTILHAFNLLTHLLIGSVVTIALIFAFRSGTSLGGTGQHIVLCVIGYQLLMAEAIMSLSSVNGWSSQLKLVDKRRAHYILQVIGSSLAIAGTFVKNMDKSAHWTTIHGKFGLVALVFTTVSLANGIATLWSAELSRFLPPLLSKLTHICFGSVAFGAAGICLCFGFNKDTFRSWISDSIAVTAISLTACLTILVIVLPVSSFYNKSKISLVSK